MSKKIIDRMNFLSKEIDKKRSNLISPQQILNEFYSCCQKEVDEYMSLSRKLRLNKKPEYKEIPEYGYLMTIDDFIECSESGGFIDYDGSGNYATNEKMSNITILPSDIISEEYRRDFTHVVWFNK